MKKDMDVLEKIFMIIALCEAVFFVLFVLAGDDDRYKVMCMTGVIVAGVAAFIMAMGMLSAFLKSFFSERRAALRALGKHGLKVAAKDEGARTAYRGILMLTRGRYPEAEEHLMRALSISDNRQNQQFCIEWMIRLYEAQENEGQLMWAYRKAVEIAPDNPDAQSRLGHAYYDRGKLSSAEYCFEQALRYDPNYGYAYYMLAGLFLLRGEDEKSLETLKKLVTINENHPLVYAELATWYAMHDDEKSAEEAYDKAILCGYKEPDGLSKRMTALRMFNHAENATGADLPQDYYRYIEKEETDTVKEDTDAGNV